MIAFPSPLFAKGGASGPPPPPPNYGPELVTNGTFDTNTSAWGSSGTIAAVAGKLRVSSTGSSNGAKQTIFGLEIGASYRFTAAMFPSETDRARIGLSYGSSQVFYFAVVGSAVDFTFVAPGTGIDIVVEAASATNWASNGQYADFDDISLKKIV